MESRQAVHIMVVMIVAKRGRSQGPNIPLKTPSSLIPSPLQKKTLTSSLQVFPKCFTIFQKHYTLEPSFRHRSPGVPQMPATASGRHAFWSPGALTPASCYFTR